ncbi:hypothetical protein JW905_15485 [bacterium]|nr:hypothetical protein [candidate division CSSED10-310 bacterium]
MSSNLRDWWYRAGEAIEPYRCDTAAGDRIPLDLWSQLIDAIDRDAHAYYDSV